MSTADWFTLRPLNFMTRQDLDNDINNIMTRLTRLEDDNTYIMNILDQTWDMITQINLDILTFKNRVGALEGNVANINTQLQQLQGLPAQVNDINARLNSLNGRVDPLFGRINKKQK
jgi:peptidoglycan hydrolase CwlO-like protein